jgi:hypothetical protein
MSTGHHACEADYGRTEPSYPADGMASESVAGTDEHTPEADPHQEYVDRLWREFNACRATYRKHWAEHGQPHPDVCPVCKARMGAFQKCRACDWSGAVLGSRCWEISAIFRDMRKRGLSTYASRIGERVA